MAKSYIVLLFAALFIFSSAANSFRLPETLEFSDDFLAFGGGGARGGGFGGGARSGGFGGGARPAPISRPTPIARPAPIARPTPVISRPAPVTPRPTPAPRPQVPAPKPQIPVPKPQTPAPKPQVPAPKPQVPTPKPQVPAPKPQIPPAQTKPIVPATQIKPTIPHTQTKPGAPLDIKPNLNLPNAKPTTTINANAGINNGQPNAQASITHNNGKNTFGANAEFNGGRVNAGAEYTRTNGGSSFNVGGGIQDGKAAGHVGATQNIGVSTLSGRADFRQGEKPTGKLDLSTPIGTSGNLQTGMTFGGGNQPGAYLQGSNTVNGVTYSAGANLQNGRVGVQGGLQAPVGNHGGTLSATAGFTPGAGANAQVELKIPF